MLSFWSAVFLSFFFLENIVIFCLFFLITLRRNLYFIPSLLQQPSLAFFKETQMLFDWGEFSMRFAGAVALHLPTCRKSDRSRRQFPTEIPQSSDSKPGGRNQLVSCEMLWPVAVNNILRIFSSLLETISVFALTRRESGCTDTADSRMIDMSLVSFHLSVRMWWCGQFHSGSHRLDLTKSFDSIT